MWQQLLIQNDYNDVDEYKKGNKQKSGKRANYRVKYIQIDRQTCRQTDRNIYTDIESDRVLITPYNTNNNTNNTITCQTNLTIFQVPQDALRTKGNCNFIKCIQPSSAFCISNVN